ncbi:U6 snRNA phosphodiesterase Usb1, partial [Massariosphaeria phaeospora]
AQKRKRPESESATSELPPLPAAFHDLYSTNARLSTSDDPSLHGGRKRAIPHVEGNWPSHVYLEWIPSQAESDHLHRLIEHIRVSIALANKSRDKPVPDITPSLQSPLGAPLPLHVSLSRTLQIKTEDREHFLTTLNTWISAAKVRPFHITFSALKWVPNYERNRWFLVLGIAKPAHDELNRLLKACNGAAEKCGYPGLYTGGEGDGPMEDETPSGSTTKRIKTARGRKHAEVAADDRFHISIAWNLIESDPEWIALVKSIDVSGSPEAPFSTVKAKVGNYVKNIELDTRKTMQTGRGGGI